MSKIGTLIAELCPDGVEYREVGDVLNYEQPTNTWFRAKTIQMITPPLSLRRERRSSSDIHRKRTASIQQQDEPSHHLL